MGYIGLCGPKGLVFQFSVLVIKWLSVLDTLVINGVSVLHSCLDLGMFFKTRTFSSLSIKSSAKNPS